jgi:hypothetical protein
VTYLRTAIAVLAGLCALVLPTPASAVATFTWIEAPCASGAITEYAGSPDGRVTLSGWIQPCGEPRPDAAFGIMRYHETAATLLYVTPSQIVRPYGSTTAPTAFTAEYTMDGHGTIDEMAHGTLRAICVVRAYGAPVACVGIDRPTASGAPLVSPIATDDLRVTSVPEIRIPADKKTDPACGNCV